MNINYKYHRPIDASKECREVPGNAGKSRSSHCCQGTCVPIGFSWHTFRNSDVFIRFFSGFNANAYNLVV